MELAFKLSSKRGDPYSQVVNFIRQRIRFDILRICVIYLRGERGVGSLKSKKLTEMDLAQCNLSDQY